MSKPRRIILRSSAALVALAGVAWGIVLWRMPEAPDPATMDAKDAVLYFASNDFEKLWESQKETYARAVIERLKRESMDDLLKMVMDRGGDLEQKKRVGKNIHNMKEHDAIESAFMAMFLDKFYEQSLQRRMTQMTMMILAQRTEQSTHPNRFLLPTPDRLKKDMGRFMSQQPPKVQAQMQQLMLDMRRQREMMGIKDPWEERK